MTASYPTASKSFSTKVDGVDLVQAAHVNDLQDEVKAIEDQLISSTLASIDTAAKLRDLIHPVGSIYMSVSSTNPGALFGGTWAAWGAGRVPVGIDASQTEFDTVEETGGEKTHTLTTAEMPAHTHFIAANLAASTFGLATTTPVSATGADYTLKRPSEVGNADVGLSSSTGGGGAHNNLQPYIVCYMWKRVS